MLRTAGLTAGYGRDVLARVDLSIETGITAVVGRNGAGKSTLLRTLATAIPPRAGELFIHGAPVRDRRSLERARRHLALVPQEPRFPRSFTLKEMLQYSAAVQRVDAAADRVDEVLESFDLVRWSATALGELSGGLRQRAFLAQATVHEPSVLLLDEPTVGLDIPSRRDFIDHLHTLAGGRAILFSTHRLDDVLELADHVVVISDGSAVLAAVSDLATAAESGVPMDVELTRWMGGPPV